MSDILDTIDGAIWEYETSNDAMRWRPPEQHQINRAPNPILRARWHAEGESLPDVMLPLRIVGHTYDGDANTLRVQLAIDPARFAEAMDRLTASLVRMQEQFRGLTWSIDSDPPPIDATDDDLRAAALWTTRNRGHGPEAPLDRRRRNLP